MIWKYRLRIEWPFATCDDETHEIEVEADTEADANKLADEELTEWVFDQISTGAELIR